MSTGAKTPRPRKDTAGRARAKLADLPETIPILHVADRMGVSVDVLKDWVAKGLFPQPHSVFERTWLYRVDHLRVFLESGRWPEGMKFHRPATRRGEG